MIEFETTIQEASRVGAYVRIPSEVVKRLGGGGRIPVVATFDGLHYRASIVRMGRRVGVRCSEGDQGEPGKGTRHEVEVTVERDDTDRKVEVPTELAELLQADPAAHEAFEALSYSQDRGESQGRVIPGVAGCRF